jgi:hypothetical protein
MFEEEDYSSLLDQPLLVVVGDRTSRPPRRRQYGSVVRCLFVLLLLSAVALALALSAAYCLSLQHNSHTKDQPPPPQQASPHRHRHPHRPQQEQQQEQDHGHAHPTLLSVVDETTMEYLQVSEQSLLYDIWKTTLVERTSDNRALRLDKTHLSELRDYSLTLSWEPVMDRHHPHQLPYPYLVQDSDVLALWCGDHDHFFEAATIAQAKATNRKHQHQHQHYGGHSNTSWYIPHFPITREQNCHFTLYSTSTSTIASLTGTSLEEDFQHAVVAIASSPPLHLRHMTETPTHLHLALGDDQEDASTTMTVQFTTGSTGTPVCMYGTEKPTQTIEGVSTTYSASDMCAAPANTTGVGKFMDPGQLHTISLTNLQPDTSYQYKVGITFGQGIVWSDIYQFTSPPTLGSYPYSYLAYGDQGCPTVGWGSGGEWTAGMAARETKVRAVHHFGDLSYARGAAFLWDEWLTMVQAFSTRLPLMIAVGNHEYDYTTTTTTTTHTNEKDPSGVNASHGYMPKWGNFGDDSGGECGVPVAKRFAMPGSTTDHQGSNSVFWYSYNSASVHTTVLSSEHDLSPKSRQYQWLEHDLQAVNRTRTPWVVVELHRPLYMNEAKWKENAVGIGLRRGMEGLLKDYHVDLVLAGHYHAYFRSCSGLFQSQCANGGPTHITVGTAGAKLDHHIPFYNASWAARNIQGVYGYGRITIPNATALHFEFVRAGAQDDKAAGSVLDDVWIRKD